MRERAESASPPTIPVLFRLPRVSGRVRVRTGERWRLRSLVALLGLSAAPLVALVAFVAWEWISTSGGASSVGPWPIAGIHRPAPSPVTHEWQNLATTDAPPKPAAADLNPGNRLGRRAGVGEERR
jgi:hypothetical protein